MVECREIGVAQWYSAGIAGYLRGTVGGSWGSSVVECRDSGVAQWLSAGIAGISVVECRDSGVA